MSDASNFFNGFKKGMQSFGENIIIIVNTAMLFAVYLIGVGLTSIIAKLAKKHFLGGKISKKEKTYWEDLNLKKKPIEEYYRQF